MIAKFQDQKVYRVGNGPLAPICGGYIEIHAPARDGEWSWGSKRQPEVLLDDTSDQGHHQVFTFPDVNARFPNEKICLALISVRNPGSPGMEGLILKQCGSGNEFKRVGVFGLLFIHNMGLFIQPLIKDTNKLRQMEDLGIKGWFSDESPKGMALNTILQGLKPEDLEL